MKKKKKEKRENSKTSCSKVCYTSATSITKFESVLTCVMLQKTNANKEFEALILEVVRVYKKINVILFEFFRISR